MARKKTYYPITLCGSYFPTEYLSMLKKSVMEELDEKIELIDFITEMFNNFDYTDCTYLQNMILLDVKNVIMYDEDSFEPGYFIGLDFLETPEQFSKKRIQIDVRNLFVKCGFIPDNSDPKEIQIFSRVVGGK